jgi:hypothetical protein
MYKVGSQSVPRPKYFSSCEDGTTGQTVLYISFSIGESWPGGMNDWAPDPTAGMMLRAVLNDEGQLEVMQARQFPECRQMEGVATSDDCSTVAVICRVAPESTMVVDADARDDQTALEDKDQLWLSMNGRTANGAKPSQSPIVSSFTRVCLVRLGRSCATGKPKMPTVSLPASRQAG